MVLKPVEVIKPFQHFLHSHVEFPFSRKQKKTVLAISSDCSEAPTSAALVPCFTLDLCNSRSMGLMFIDTWQDQAIVSATCKIKIILSSSLNITVMLLAGHVVPALFCYAPYILHWDIMFIRPLRLEVLFLLLQSHICPWCSWFIQTLICFIESCKNHTSSCLTAHSCTTQDKKKHIHLKKNYGEF